MNLLGIETSCDETAAAVVENGRLIRSNIVASSLEKHKKYGGIIPEIASRHQLELINVVVQKALDGAKLKITDVNAIAVTTQPGLIGSLLVGVSYARALSTAIKKPLVEVDHIKSHLYANFLTSKTKTARTSPKIIRPRLPAIGLVVSGGHSSLYFVKNYTTYKLLGQTRDDAAGEAFDKVARILDLGYPGGPIIDKLAQKGKNKDIIFNCAELPNSYDFSFSGVKTAVLYYKQRQSPQKQSSVEKIAYSFQKSVISILVKKCILACLKKNVKTVLVGGGVAANTFLRDQLNQEAKKYKIKVHFPPLNLCLDNAAMIAGFGYHLLKERSASVRRNI